MKLLAIDTSGPVAAAALAEETDGTSQSILQAVRTIEGSYERYAEEAHLAGADHSYEKIGGRIYEQLSRF